METTNKLTANQKAIIMNNPRVQKFDRAFATLENAGRIAGVRMACLIYQADNDGTNAAMGLASAADYLIQMRGYSKSQAMNLQRVGKFLKGDEKAAVDVNGNSMGLSAIVQLLESANDEEQAHKLIADGTVSALTPVKKLKKQLDKLNGKEIAAESTAKDVTEGESKAAADIPSPKDDPKPYNVNIAILVPDGNGGDVTFKSKSGKYALSAIVGPVQSLAKECTAPGAKIVVTIEPVK